MSLSHLLLFLQLLLLLFFFLSGANACNDDSECTQYGLSYCVDSQCQGCRDDSNCPPLSPKCVDGWGFQGTRGCICQSNGDCPSTEPCCYDQDCQACHDCTQNSDCSAE